MSEKDSSNADPDFPEENGAAADQSEETIPDSEVPTLPDVPRPDTEVDGSDSSLCPTCGAEIPPEAPRGLCPKCALAGAAVPTDVDSLGGRSRSGPRFEPPEIETVAAAFPLLEIVELIGCGGMGAVYKARQPHLDRFVALKILPPSLAETPGFTDRFTREGRLLAKLSHPAIVGVHDFGQAGGFFFLLMEYVDGVNLRQAMRAGRFTPEQALDIVPKVCEALQFAHDTGVLHRDIKPENILLDSKGVVKIADFGIAKLLDEAAGADPTLTGSMAPGTPHYMAPEQIEQPETVDHRADIYSLGVVFYEMLTGELPIGRFAAPSEKAAVDSQIDEIVFRSLEKERDRRQQSAGEVKTEIEGVPVADIASERHPGYAIPASGPEAVARSSGGRKAALIVLAGFLLPVILNLVFLVVITTQQRRIAEQMVQADAAKTEAAKNFHRANAELGRLESELSKVAEDSERAEAIQHQIVAKKQQADRFALEMERSRQYPAEVVTAHRSWIWIWVPFGSMTLLGILLLGTGVAGTIMGWTSLRRIRALDLPERRILPMFAALFFPLLLMGILVFALVALPMSFGPKWVAALGVSLSVIAAGGLAFLVIRAVLRWLESPVSETERNAVLAGFMRSRNPWVVGLIVVAVLLLAVMVIPVVFYFRMGGAGFLPGAIELIVVAAIVGFFFFLIWFFARGARTRRSEAPAAETSPPPPANPWPRRVFWLILLIFVAPVLLILLFLMVPWLAHRESPAETHSARILESVEHEHSVTIKLETRRFGNENVNFAVVYEGPKADNQTNDHDRIFPGQGQEWNLFGQERRRMDSVTFALPDRETTEKAAREIVRVTQGVGGIPVNFYDKRRIDLFNVPAGPSDAWRAWIEMRPGSVVSDSSPPVEELLVGDWQLDTGEEGEGEFTDLIVSFSPDREWSMRTRFIGADPNSSGIWKLRGGGRLELETLESTTASDVGKSEHVTIESIDDSTLVVRGQVEDDPDELMTYLRHYPPPQPIDAGQ